MSRAATWLAVVVIGLSAAWVGYRYRTTSRDPAPPLVRLKAMQIRDLDGRPVSLARWQGKILVVNFWATWCPPCREEIPEFSAAQSALGTGAVQFIGLAIDDRSEVQAFMAATSVHYPLLIAPAQALEVSADFGNAGLGLPFTMLLDRNGQLVFAKLGRLTVNELMSHLRPLLGEKP